METILQSSEIMMNVQQAQILLSSVIPRLNQSNDCTNKGAENEYKTKKELDCQQQELMPERHYSLQLSLGILSISATPYIQLFSAKHENKLIFLTGFKAISSYQRCFMNKEVDAPRWVDVVNLSVDVNTSAVNVDADIISSALSTISHCGLARERVNITSSEFLKTPINNLSMTVNTKIKLLEITLWTHQVSHVVDSDISSDMVPLMRSEMQYFDLGIHCKIEDSIMSWDQARIEMELYYLCLSVCGKGTLATSMITVPIFRIGTKNLDDSFNSNPEERHFRSKVESFWNGGLQINSSTNISNGTLHLALDEMDHSITIFFSTFLPKVMPFMNFFSLKQQPSSVMKDVKSRMKIMGQKEVLTSLLRTEIELIEVALATISVENFRIIIPSKTSGKFSLQCEVMNASSAFFHDTRKLHSCVETFGSEFTLKDNAPGFHHLVSSRQKFVYLGASDALNNDQSKSLSTIMDSFSVTCCFNATRWSSKVDDCSMSIIDLDVWEDLCETVASNRTRLMNIVHSILNLAPSSTINPSAQFDKSTPVGQANILVNKSLRTQQELLQKLKGQVSLCQRMFRDDLNKKDFDLRKVKRQLFEKEVSLAHAHSLVVNQACGFVHVAGVDQEQRSSSTLNFLRYWARLTDSHIILSRHPSEVSSQRVFNFRVL